MKKILLGMLALATLSLSFASCSDSEGNPSDLTPVASGYKCTNIQCTGFNVNKDNSQYVQLFSIYFVGLGTTGKYFRVGSDVGDVAKAASGAAAIYSGNSNATAWSEFLSNGTYMVSGKTLTLTSDKGTETYTITDGSLGGDVLALTAETKTGNSTVDNTISTISGLLSTIGLSSSAAANLTTTTFTYTKISLTDLLALFTSSSSN